MPLHKRKWCVEDVPDAETMAHELKRHAALTLCTGFRLHGYLFLNDATHEDGAQDDGTSLMRCTLRAQRVFVVPSAVLKEATFVQIESLTVSSMGRPLSADKVGALWSPHRSFDDLRATIQTIVAGADDDQALATFVSVTPDQIQTPAQHGRCGYCE